MQKKKRIVNPELLAKVRSLGCCVCIDEKKPLIYPVESHHIQTRARMGDDVETNLLPVCTRCHRLLHSMGLTTFAKKHPVVTALLTHMDWEFDEYSGRWFPPHSVS